MRRYLWVAAALSLGACAPPGYVYEDGDLLHPHPSAELCASKNLVLDPNTKECVMPPPPVLVPPLRHAPVHRAAPSPAPKADTTDVPIEPNAVIKGDLRQNTKLLHELVKFVREDGYQCDAISAVQAYAVSRRFKLVCDQSRNTYEIEAQGRRWIVTVK
jgi:hypothetical protein